MSSNCKFFLSSQDFIIYPITGESTVFGHSTNVSASEKAETQAVDVSLWAPDIKPQHCGIHRLRPEASPSGKESGKGPWTTLVKPFQGSLVKRNGIILTQETLLCNGDFLGLGEYYLFLFKDPTAAEGLLPYSELISAQMAESQLVVPLCNTCVLTSGAVTSKRPRETAGDLSPCLKGFDSQELSVVYNLEHEQSVLKEIFTLAAAQRSGEPKLTPALMLCLCLQRAATHFSTASLRKLLLHIASEVQKTVWVCARFPFVLIKK